MAKFVKKPIVISAWLFDGTQESIQHLLGMQGDGRIVKYKGEQKNSFGIIPPELSIHTLEGIMYANVGDYIIRGIRGELYPCKPDIFRATYDEVSD